MYERTSELRRAGIGLTLLLLLAGGMACPAEREPTTEAGDPAAEEAASEEAPAGAAEAAAPAEVPDDPVFTWYDSRGRPHLAGSIEEVPVAFRGQVVVSQLGGGAEVALAETVTVADFRETNPTYSTVDLAALSASASTAGDASLDHQKIFVYSAEWCGFCKKVKAFFEENSVPYIERDIEEDPGAAAELKAKAEATGLGSRGIPVTDIHGKLIVGFKPTDLGQRLEEVGIELKGAPGPKAEGDTTADPPEPEVKATPRAPSEHP